MTTRTLFHSPVLWHVSLRRKQFLSENPLQILTFHKSLKRAVTETTASEVFLTMNDNKRRTSTWYSNGFDNGQVEQDTTVQNVCMSACASDTTRAKDAVSRTTAARCRYSASRTKAGYPRPPSLLRLVAVVPTLVAARRGTRTWRAAAVRSSLSSALRLSPSQRREGCPRRDNNDVDNDD